MALIDNKEKKKRNKQSKQGGVGGAGNTAGQGATLGGGNNTPSASTGNTNSGIISGIKSAAKYATTSPTNLPPSIRPTDAEQEQKRSNLYQKYITPTIDTLTEQSNATGELITRPFKTTGQTYDGRVDPARAVGGGASVAEESSIAAEVKRGQALAESNAIAQAKVQADTEAIRQGFTDKIALAGQTTPAARSQSQPKPEPGVTEKFDAYVTTDANGQKSYSDTETDGSTGIKLGGRSTIVDTLADPAALRASQDFTKYLEARNPDNGRSGGGPLVSSGVQEERAKAIKALRKPGKKTRFGTATTVGGRNGVSNLLKSYSDQDKNTLNAVLGQQQAETKDLDRASAERRAGDTNARQSMKDQQTLAKSASSQASREFEESRKFTMKALEQAMKANINPLTGSVIDKAAGAKHTKLLQDFINSGLGQ